MSESLNQARLQNDINQMRFTAQWPDICERIDSLPSAEQQALLEWVLFDYDGYVAVRSSAGLLLLNMNYNRYWSRVVALLESTDPDARDTLFEILAARDDAKARKVMLGLIEDEHSYIQIEALDHLQHYYPELVQHKARANLNSAHEELRQHARTILATLDPPLH